jgi:L-iditol 2-dehydrogenase
MLEPVNTVLKAIKRLNLLRGDFVLVAGQGPIGLMFTRLLALRGINVIASDLLESRLRLARQWGATLALDAANPRFEKMIGLIVASMGRARHSMRAVAQTSKSGAPRTDAPHLGLDAAIIAVPSDETVVLAEKLIRGGGQILLFAHTHRGKNLSIDPAAVCVDEKDLIGSYSSDFTLQNEVARLIFSRKLDVQKLVTHQFPLENAAAAIDLAACPMSGALKIVVSQI